MVVANGEMDVVFVNLLQQINNSFKFRNFVAALSAYEKI